ncbi:aminodeoxychorismate lyase [Methyloradius palustris]|uniref:aminodeoxychorismate lyase n=1 Tax=Methyloradius palustris TaxID=2778876 RepID=A0A8D5K0T4_9PROT|nr:aminodeoxychorismate lyase [Methyloradius palustris]BCM25063.1 aminodeoxychorismate lyase [Methyloradius palustris]
MTASQTNKSKHVLINGQQDESLSPFDRGFSYGDGVFRTLPVIKGHPDSWLDHYKKLMSDCHVLGIVCPSAEILLSDIEKLIQASSSEQSKKQTPSKETPSFVIKIIITRGESERGYAMPALAQPSRVLICSDFPTYPESSFVEGVKLHLCNLRLSHQPLLAGIKHLNRLENVIARAEWQDSNIIDGVLLDANNMVIECTSSNIFARFGTQLHTPDLSNCGVAGLTRQRILELAGDLSLQRSVSNISLSHLMQADEIIICNSLFGAWQVREFNHQHWPQLPLANQLRTLLKSPHAHH